MSKPEIGSAGFVSGPDGKFSTSSKKHPNLTPEIQSTFYSDLTSENVTSRLNGEIKRLPLKDLNAIVQARNQYGDISILTEAIRSSGTLLHTPFAAQFDKVGAQRYLSFVYSIYGDKVPDHKKIDDLVHTSDENGNDVYYIVIAGHRRLKALEELGEEYTDVKIKKDINPLDALYIQAQENTQKSLTDDERAEQHGRLWVVSKTREPKLTLEKFSLRVGVSSAILRRDIRFYSLPDEAKRYVAENQLGETNDPKKVNRPYMPFNIACQLGRLVEVDAPTYDVLFLARRFFEENITSERTASERVTRYIRSQNYSNASLNDLFDMNAQTLDSSKKTIEVARRFAQPIDDAIGYLARIKIAKETGFADLHEDGLSFAGAATRLMSLADIVEELLPSMLEVIENDEEVERISSIFKELHNIAKNIDVKIPSVETTVKATLNLP